MDLTTLEYFIKVAQTQHISRAAVELNISQPALSANIRKLENELGVSLFDRRGKFIVLNEYGRVFLKYAQNIQAQYSSARSTLQSMKIKEESCVTFTMPPLTSFPGLMNSLKEQCPNIVFRNIQTNHKERIEMVLNGTVDFCIMGSYSDNPNLESTILSYDEMVMLVPDSHPLAGCSQVDLISFRNDQFVNVSRPGASDEAKGVLTDLEIFCRQAGFEPRITYWCDQSYEMIDAIRCGKYVGMLARRILDGYNTAGIRRLSIAHPRCYSNLRLYRLANVRERAAVRMVRSCIIDYYKNSWSSPK